MKDVDAVIGEALDAEERALLRAIGEEPGYFTQLFGIFEGRTGWVNAMMMLIQSVVFVAGAWMAWRFFLAAEPLEALRWGLPAAVLLLMSLMIKLALWPSLQTNRVIRELKLIELQLARAARTD
ncbi:MAG: hypothetical protein LC648_07285 [Novosphingobium sp.]|nr:hypothetical protein [Novosphingobium sp.]